MTSRPVEETVKGLMAGLNTEAQWERMQKDTIPTRCHPQHHQTGKNKSTPRLSFFGALACRH